MAGSQVYSTVLFLIDLILSLSKCIHFAGFPLDSSCASTATSSSHRSITTLHRALFIILSILNKPIWVCCRWVCTRVKVIEVTSNIHKWLLIVFMRKIDDMAFIEVHSNICLRLIWQVNELSHRPSLLQTIEVVDWAHLNSSTCWIDYEALLYYTLNCTVLVLSWLCTKLPQALIFEVSLWLNGVIFIKLIRIWFLDVIFFTLITFLSFFFFFDWISWNFKIFSVWDLMLQERRRRDCKLIAYLQIRTLISTQLW